MIPGVAIRRYRSADHAQVMALDRAALESVGADDHGKGHDADLAEIESVYLVEGGEFLVAAAGGLVVGTGALRPAGDRIGEIKRMRVAGDRQGEGLGTELLRRLEAAARRHGYRELVLDTSPELVGAQRFYAARGFRLAGEGRVDGFACLIYRKRLSGD